MKLKEVELREEMKAVREIFAKNDVKFKFMDALTGQFNVIIENKIEYTYYCSTGKICKLNPNAEVLMIRGIENFINLINKKTILNNSISCDKPFGIGEDIFKVIDMLNAESFDKEELKKKISLCDLATSDLLHYIEFNKVDEEFNRWLFKELKTIREERREHKRNLELIIVFDGHKSNLLSANSRNILRNLVAERMNELNKSTYTNRIYNELNNRTNVTQNYTKKDKVSINSYHKRALVLNCLIDGELSVKDIMEKHNVSMSMVYDMNAGRRNVLEGLKYPIMNVKR